MKHTITENNEMIFKRIIELTNIIGQAAATTERICSQPNGAVFI
jgi:hypothetical protein